SDELRAQSAVIQLRDQPTASQPAQFVHLKQDEKTKRPPALRFCLGRHNETTTRAVVSAKEPVFKWPVFECYLSTELPDVVHRRAGFQSANDVCSLLKGKSKV